MNDICETYGTGLDNTAYYMYHEDIEGGQPTITDGVISSITPVTGARMYKIYMPANSDPYTGTTIAQDEVSIGTSFTKTAKLTLIHNNKANSDAVASMAIKKGILIFRKKNHNADGSDAFVVIGAQQGATASNATNDFYSDDSAGGWALDLIELKATIPQVFFFKTDLSTTIAALESLTEVDEDVVE